MNRLTINFTVENVEEFLEKNSKEIKKVSKIPEVKVQICATDDREQIKGSKTISYFKSSGNEYADYCTLLENTDSEYVIFYNEQNLICHDLIVKMLNQSQGCEDIAFVQPVHQGMPLTVKKTDDVKYSKEKWLDFSEKKKVAKLLYFNRYAFSTSFLRKIEFTEAQKTFYKDRIILSLLEECDGLKILNDMAVYTEEALENNINLYYEQFRKEWYVEYFKKFIIPYIETSSMNAQIQQMIMYFVELRFYFNLNGRDKFVLEGTEIDEFIAAVKEVLQFIDDEYIVETRQTGCLPKIFAYLFMKLKYDHISITTEKSGKNVSYFINGLWLDDNCVGVAIKAINFKNQELRIDCEIKGSHMIPHIEEKLKVLVNGQERERVQTKVYNITKAFGRSVCRFSTFQVVIPEKMMDKKLEIEFKLEQKKISFRLPLLFEATSARLIASRASYFEFGNHMICPDGNKLVIKKNSKALVCVKELFMLFKMLRMRKNLKEGIIADALRIYFWMTKKKYEDKPNWIFFDKLYKAGDNAEYLFDYCYRNKSDVNSYYIVNKDAIDYPRLKKKYGANILEFNSLREKMMILNADTIFATHASVLSFCGFGKSLQLCFRNLLKARIVCIQHGLTIQNIAQYQNRLQDNTAEYFCASKYEIANLKHPVYGYHDSELHLTGCPRYDGLISNDQRQILIAPTWRRNIVITGNAVGTSKSYNPDFKNTKYFEIYNGLINDERLLKSAKEHNYKLVFLIHPTLSSQLEDFDKNDYLTIIPAISDISYEKILTESSLMLTDYSGIQFDFAYMKKPVLYYHSNELPPQYEEGVYKYDTMGFGPIIEEYDEIVDELCHYMSDECQMKQMYVDRVEDFFAFTDHNNCKRILDVIENSKRE